jgi:hypothetical protein
VRRFASVSPQALRRRAHNAIDRGVGCAYQRVVSIDGGPVAISVSQNGAVDAPLRPSHSPAGR